MRARVLGVAHDAGGANALCRPLHRLASDVRLEVTIVADRQAVPIFSAARVALRPAAEWLGHAGSLEWAARTVLDTDRPHLVLSGTSLGPSLDKPLNEEARKRGIPTVAVLDSWRPYSPRFSDGATLRYLPDTIAVMDEFAKREMIEEGFDATRLVVTGQPYLDDLAEIRQGFDRLAVRRRYAARFGIEPTRPLVIFATQPLSEVSNLDPGGASRGFTEFDALRGFLTGVASLSRSVATPTVIVKCHPREAPDKYGDVVSRHGPDVIVNSDLSPRELILVADAVVGISSMLLVEAFLAGVPTISFQPGLLERDDLILTRAGLLSPVVRDEDLVPALETALSGARAPRAAWDRRQGLMALDGRATERVVELVYQRLGLASSEPRA